MKGIVLAGGNGTRLSPITNVTSKQLLLIYDKPLIFYPISTLMLAGIKDVLIICKSKDILNFQALLGNGASYGMNISYEIQEIANGLPDGIIKAEKFIAQDNFAFILGDNFFYGGGLGTGLKKINFNYGSHIFSFEVKDPHNFGVIEISKKEKILSIEEKPINPKTNKAITGLYFFSSDAVEKSKTLVKSSRNELEMVDLLRIYLYEDSLTHTPIPRGTVWLDTGSFESILETSNFVGIIQKRQNQQIANLEEIAWRQRWISDDQLLEHATNSKSSITRDYLMGLMNKY